MKWKRSGFRCYSNNDALWQCFVFGCSRPSRLWAWVVFWSNGKASGVEQSFAKAKVKAGQCSAQIESKWLVDLLGAKP